MNVVTTETRAPRARVKNQRTCAGCAKGDSPEAMVRLVLGPAVNGTADVAVDIAGGAFGRGAHVHPQPDCIAKACKGGLSRSFKTKVKADAAEIARQIVEGNARRMTGLLLGARGAKALAIGADAACEALEEGAPLVIVASDAASVVEKYPIQKAIAEGRALAWSNKAALGEVLGRNEVAVCAVRDKGIAQQMLYVGSRCFACRSEVR